MADQGVQNFEQRRWCFSRIYYFIIRSIFSSSYSFGFGPSVSMGGMMIPHIGPLKEREGVRAPNQLKNWEKSKTTRRDIEEQEHENWKFNIVTQFICFRWQRVVLAVKYNNLFTAFCSRRRRSPASYGGSPRASLFCAWFREQNHHQS